MKKIFIYAYTKKNLGDDLFVKTLCERYPQHQFYIQSRKSDADAFLQIKNLKVFYSVPYLDSVLSRLSLEHIITNRIVNQCDIVVNIGGSIFIEPENWKRHIYKYTKRIQSNKPFYIIGSNFGPYTSTGFYESYKEIFKRVEDICFRDEYSYNIYSDLENVRTASDAVYSLDVNAIINNNISKTITISVINLDDRKGLSIYREKYENKLIEVTVELVKKGYEVLLMSFCEKEGDLKAIKRIKKGIPRYFVSNIKTYDYQGDLDEALGIIKSSQGIVATRFHSMILGWLFEIPVFPIIYSIKTENVLKEINFQGSSTWIQEIDRMKSSEIVSQILSNDIQDVGNEIKESRKQFSKLDEVLYKNEENQRMNGR